MAAQKTDPHLAELQMIRKLLVLALLRNGLTQGQVGGVLGLTQQQVSAMFPSGALTALKGKGKKASSKNLDAPEVQLDG
jgi:transcriptional regulator